MRASGQVNLYFSLHTGADVCLPNAMGVDKIKVETGENRQKYKFSDYNRALGEWKATIGDHVRLARGQSETHL